MKKFIYLLAVASIFSFTACRNASHANQSIEVLTADAFEQKINENQMSQLLDVRTPEEFESGHINGAINYNVNDAGFESQINNLDKSKPVMVYCHSGHRSATAADILASKGFTKVYNLDGGIMKWNAAEKSVVSGANQAVPEGMTIDNFNNLVNSNKLVLVDYRAKWCKPCVKMAPMLESVVKARQDKMVLLPIDADQNQKLLKEKGIESVPVLELYQNGKRIWSHTGEIDEATLIKEAKL